MVTLKPLEEVYAPPAPEPKGRKREEDITPRLTPRRPRKNPRRHAYRAALTLYPLSRSRGGVARKEITMNLQPPAILVMGQPGAVKPTP